MKEKMEKKKDKTLSKAALAKKLHKKNIVVNKKVVFDEEGEVRETARTTKHDDNCILA